MDNVCINKGEFMGLIRNGIYYNPATKHYGQEGIVFCDLCKKQDLSICIGYDSYDLCLQCVQQVVDCVDKTIKCPCSK